MSIKLSYPLKIILAWGEAITGNRKIRDWLMANDYKELGLFCFALRNEEQSREWLLKNGYPHLMALINGAEGNHQALQWLQKNNLPLLKYIAEAADNNEESMDWLMKNSTEEFFLLAQKIRFVKNRIEEDNADAHKFNNT